MIEWLESIDREIVLFVNGMNHPALDEIMWIISAKLTWVPFYLLLLYLYFRKAKSWKDTLIFLLVAVAAVGAADFISSQLLKDTIMRYRPSHHALLTDKLHFYQTSDGEFYKGGMYGFVSSHAANFFAICTFAYLVLRPFYRKSYWLFVVAGVVSFSRLYLGVHYLSDLVCGGLLGASIAWLLHHFVFLKLGTKK